MQPPVKFPKESHPVDLGPEMLAELSSVMACEARAHDALADAADTRGDPMRAADHSLTAMGLWFDAKEILYWADVAARRRERSAYINLPPWKQAREHKRYADRG